MKLVEIRDLDGPNLFLLEPAIKVEFAFDAADKSPAALESLAARLGRISPVNNTSPIAEQLQAALFALHKHHSLACPTTTWAPLETAGHEALAFGWTQRRFALGVARLLADAACGTTPISETQVDGLASYLDQETPDDAPLMVRDADRTMPVVSITGTNGKTTTTRLIAHIVRQSGKRVGWSSSSGVFIEGVQVMEGDYTGPSGALRVLNDPDVDVAVLETARGGILMRGVAYESNDVSVFTNVSADHIDLHGIRTVEGLANAKATIIRITKPDGYAVLNADDRLVLAQSSKTRARLFFVTQRGDDKTVATHIANGGSGLTVDNGEIIFWQDRRSVDLIAVDDIPIAFRGSARHMLENALCAAAACLGLGLPVESVRNGLATFTSTPADNLGRLNLYEVNAATVVVDFAHNEAGLRHLLGLASQIAKDGGKLIAIIGTAGDRTDANLRAIGQIAAESADKVIVKETAKYLRGRSSNEEINEHYIAGIKAGGKREWTIAPSELDALKQALDETSAGDVVAMMCVEQVQAVYEYLQTVGNPSPLGQARPH